MNAPENSNSLAALRNFDHNAHPDFDAIQREIEAGYIYIQRHPTAPLRIYNYSSRTQYDNRWNQATMQCRGLIVDDQDQIVARPFAKFFTYEQLNGVVPNEPFEAYEKLDGSLGVLYSANGKMQIATRGSFAGKQAQRATEIYQRQYGHVRVDERLTYLFEVIYPENRIVVDYGAKEDLILLAVIETKTGIEQPLPEIGFPIVKRYDGIRDFAELLTHQEQNREGFVVRFESGQRVKLKFEEYKRLHKLLTGISPLRIWDVLRDNHNLEKILDCVPDEYYAWVRNIETDLRSKFAAIEQETKQHVAAMPSFESRKEQASYISQSKYPGVAFAMLDGKPHADMIWRMLRPTDTGTFLAAE